MSVNNRPELNAFARREARIVEDAMLTTSVITAPINMVGMAIEKGCKANETAKKLCKVIGTGIEKIIEQVPEEYRKAYGAAQKRYTEKISGHFKSQYGIPESETQEFSKNVEAIGWTAVGAGVGGAAIKAGKKIKENISVRMTKYKQVKEGIRLPEIDNITFDHRTAKQTGNIKVGSKSATDFEVTILKGNKDSLLFFIEWIGNAKNKRANAFSGSMDYIAKYAKKEKAKNVFIQLCPIREQMTRVISKVVDVEGKHPYFIPKCKDILNDPDHLYPVFSLRQNSQRQVTNKMKDFARRKMFEAGAAGVVTGVVTSNAEATEHFSKIEKSSDKLSQYNSELIAHLSSDEITGFEGNDDILNLHKDLEELKKEEAPKEKIQEKETALKNEKAKSFIRDKKVQETCDQLLKDVGNLSGIVGHLGRGKEAQQIATIGSSAIGMFSTISSLAAGTLNPFSGGLALANLGLNILGGFSEDSGPSANEIIMDQLAAISEQIETLRKEIHERFDIVDEKLDRLLDISIQGIDTIVKNQRTQYNKLLEMEQKIDQSETHIRLHIEEVQKNLQSLKALFQDIQREKLYKQLKRVVFGILQEETPDLERFKKRAEKLSTHALLDARGVSHANSEMPLSIKPVDFDTSIQRIFSALKSKDEKEKEKHGNIPNPTHYTIAALGLLLLTLKQYPTIKAKPLSMICTEDVTRLKKVFKMGKHLKSQILGLKKRVTASSLLKEYKTEGLDPFMEHVKKVIGEYEKELNEFYNVESLKLHIDHYSSVVDINKFNKKWENTEFTTSPKGGNWFTGWYGKEAGEGTFNPGRRHFACNRYNSTIQSGIKATQTAYINRRKKEQLNGYSSRFNLFNQECQLAPIEMPWFIHPQDPTLSLLPVPEDLKDFIPLEVKKALSKYLGHLKLEYKIEGKNFQIICHFIPVASVKPFPVLKLSLPYDGKFFKKEEGVWLTWAGGTYCDNLKGGVWTHYHTGSSNGNACYEYAYIPVGTAHSGMVDKFKSLISKKEELNLSKLKEEIVKKQKEQLKDKMEKLVLDLKNRDGKECLQLLDEHYKRLLGFLSVVQRDFMMGKNKPFQKCLSSFVHSEKAIKFLESSEVDSSTKGKNSYQLLLEHSKKWNGKLEEFFKKLEKESSLEHSFKMLESTLNTLKYFIKYYKPHQVRHNRWYTSKQTEEFKDDVISASVRGLGKILNMSMNSGDTLSAKEVVTAIQEIKNGIGNALNALDPESKQHALATFNALFNPNKAIEGGDGFNLKGIEE